ncbi:hypothetical protein CF319_g8695 [Tilletia indica]|nr:hypothetical protein CF319_g8695 [Tilletia indica]
MNLLLTQDEDEWDVSAAATCIGRMAACVGDAIDMPAIHFIEGSIKSEDWRRREAACMCFGSIREGPTVETLTSLVPQAARTVHLTEIAQNLHPFLQGLKDAHSPDSYTLFGPTYITVDISAFRTSAQSAARCFTPSSSSILARGSAAAVETPAYSSSTPAAQRQDKLQRTRSQVSELYNSPCSNLSFSHQQSTVFNNPTTASNSAPL